LKAPEVTISPVEEFLIGLPAGQTASTSESSFLITGPNSSELFFEVNYNLKSMLSQILQV